MVKEIKVDLSQETQSIMVNNILYKINLEVLKKDECVCGCGRSKKLGRSKYHSDACRKKVSRLNQKKSS